MDESNACTVEGCAKPVKRLGLCYGHYMKQWRYGTPTPKRNPTWVDLRGQRFGSLTVLERQGSKWLCRCDCGQTTGVRAGDLNRGSALTCGSRRTHRRRDDAGYTAAHDRVRRDRGPAHAHVCADCGDPARHWSYDHDDPDELHVAEGATAGIAYSLKPEHYSPRCVPCHKRYDLARLDAAQAGR